MAHTVTTKYKTMRTKTIIAAAALLAAGALTSMAQSNVYSVNVVGYVNVNLSSGFNLIANQLDYDGTGLNNTVQNVFGTNLVGTVYAFSGGAFASPAASYSSKTGWTGGTNAANAALKPGGAVFAAVSAPKTITLVGTVDQGALSTPYIAGFNMIASQVPQAGLMQTDLGYAPSGNVTVYRYNAGTQTYASPASTWSSKTGWSPSQPSLNVGEGVFLATSVGGTWTRNFTVQ